MNSPRRSLPSLEPLVALRIQSLTHRKPFISRRNGAPLRAPGFYAVAVLVFLAALTMPIVGHERSGPATAAPRTAVAGAVLERFEETARSLNALAAEIPATGYAWRPAPGEPSTRQLILAAAATHHELAAALGAGGGTPTGLASLSGKESVVAALEGSLRRAGAGMRAGVDGAPGDTVSLDGHAIPRATVALMLLASADQHLGRLRVYARSSAARGVREESNTRY